LVRYCFSKSAIIFESAVSEEMEEVMKRLPATPLNKGEWTWLVDVECACGYGEFLRTYALFTIMLMIMSPDFSSAKCFRVPAMRSFGPVDVDMSARTACAVMEWVEDSLLASSVHVFSDDGEV